MTAPHPSVIRWERCGHRRNPKNTSKVGGCKKCAGAGGRRTIRIASAVRHGKWPKCGHERTEENTANRGKGTACCRQCKLAQQQAWRDRNPLVEQQRRKAERAKLRRVARQARIDADNAAIALYRTEKQQHLERVRQTVIAEAKLEFEAALERQRQDRNKGGRPRKAGVARPAHRSDFTRPDADDLTRYLSPFFGRAS